jgi:predicted anti-sigma-YlaC factor YlaD
MSCRRIDSFLSASLDEALSTVDQAELDAHLAACPACVRRLQGYGVTAQFLRRLGSFEAVEAAPPIPETLVHRIVAAAVAGRHVAREEGRRTG